MNLKQLMATPKKDVPVETLAAILDVEFDNLLLFLEGREGVSIHKATQQTSMLSHLTHVIPVKSPDGYYRQVTEAERQDARRQIFIDKKHLADMLPDLEKWAGTAGAKSASSQDSQGRLLKALLLIHYGKPAYRKGEGWNISGIAERISQEMASAGVDADGLKDSTLRKVLTNSLKKPDD